MVTYTPFKALHGAKIEDDGNAEINVERYSGTNIRIQSQTSAGKIVTSTAHPLWLGANATGRIEIQSGGLVNIPGALTVSGTFNATLATAAQTNITSLGSLSSLDVNGDATVSGNLSLDGSNKELRFYEGANYVGFEAPALSANKIWVLPAADGSANQALTTDGSGNFQWASVLHVGTTAYEVENGIYLTGSNQRSAQVVIHADDANTNWYAQDIGLALHNEDPTNNNWSPHIAFTTHEDDDGNPSNANPVAVAAISATYNTRNANSWASGALCFFTNDNSGNLERMRIAENGKVGIGTTAPEYKLDVQDGSIRILPTISSSVGTAIRIGARNNGNDITLLRVDGEGAGEGAGNSGESDSAKYGFSMKYMGSGSGTGNRYAMFMDNQAGTAIEAMSILQDGKVGIGTATPSTKLQVSGTVTATAFAGALTGDVTGNADTATLAATVTVAQDNDADAAHYINFTDDNTGANAIKVDTGLTYNPASNMITATRFQGALIGNADTVTNGVYTTGNQTVAGIKTLSSYMVLTGDNTAAPSDSTSVHLGEDDGQLEIRTQYGTIQLGSTSVSWNHIEGSQGRFYFNQPVVINGNGTYGNLSSYSTEDLILSTNSGTETRMTIKQDTGNVGIGTTTPTHKLQVNGSFTATTKEFTIPHPSKKGMTLSHGSLEGPEYGVYVRGKSKDRKVYLPDYWKDLVHENSITVQLTPIGKSENLYVVDYNTEYIEVASTQPGIEIEYFYYVQAERKDVDKLKVEF